MAIISGKDTNWTAKRGIVQNGLVLHFDAAMPNTCSTTLFKNLTGQTSISLANSPTITNDRGGMIFFDGGDDYGLISDPTDTYLLSSAGSICCWSYISSITQGQQAKLIGKAAHSNTMAGYIWALAILGNGTNGVSPAISSAGVQLADGSYTYNVWQYVCSTWSGGTTTIYKNGSSVGTGATSFGAQQQVGQPLILGRYGDWVNFPTYLPMIKVYNRGLSSTEISQNYNATRKRFGL